MESLRPYSYWSVKSILNVCKGLIAAEWAETGSLFYPTLYVVYGCSETSVIE
jgi:hypothetical protein